MAIRLLHTGDLHLGASFAFLGDKGPKQRQKLLTTFDKIVDLAVSEHVNLLLIAGDLFDSNNPSYTTIDRVVDSLQKLEQAGIPVCLIPGSHDPYGPCSIYNLYDFKEALSNLTILAGERAQLSFKDLDLTVYGLGVSDGWRPKDCLKNFTASPKTKYHVGLLHGSIEGFREGENDENNLLSADDIKNSKMNYVALGHNHSFTNCFQDGTKAFYCGSPSMLELHRNHGHVILATIDPSGEVDVRPKRVSHSYHKTENFPVEGLKDVGHLRELLEAKAHPQVFYEIRLIGKSRLDFPLNRRLLSNLQKEFGPRFLRLSITDDTSPQLDESSVGMLPENTVLGQFINLMRDEIAKSDAEDVSMNEKALKLGFTLLTEGSVNEDSQDLAEQI